MQTNDGDEEDKNEPTGHNEVYVVLEDEDDEERADEEEPGKVAVTLTVEI